MLKKYEEKNYLKRNQRLKLSPQNSILPQIYGLPKIHKENVPLRPIVSAIGSPTHNLAKFIVKIISSISGNTKLYVNNSTHFVDIINDPEINPNDLMLSFDVVSLFTKSP